MPSAQKSVSKARARQRAFGLDMTPLVDVAFLLLCFFVVQAAIARAHVLQLTMPRLPDEDYIGCDLCSGKTTVILGRKHQVYYYFGLDDPTDSSAPKRQVYRTDFSAGGIRKLLLKLQKQPVPHTVLIEASPGATYRDLVDILDEMLITNQRKYALVNLSAADRQLLPATERQ